MTQATSGFPFWGQLLIELLKLLVSALVSAYIAVKVVNRLKSQSDHVEKRIDDICADIRSVADLASDYWIRDASNDLLPLAVRIQARIRLIEELRQATAAVAPELTTPPVGEASQEFLRIATGGDFGVHNRPPEIGRASDVQNAATRYIVRVRRARLALHGAARVR